MYKEEKDPGIGINYKKQTKRVINQDGSFNVVRKGGVYPFEDLYQYMVNMSWIKLVGLIFAFYFLVNGVFASIYMLIGAEGLSNSPDSNLIDQFFHTFFFSVQTFTTVGYGAISPEGWGASMVASVEAMLGLISFAFATGLLYGRFSRPNAKFVFSEKMVIAPYKEGNALMFRVANKRSNVLMELEVSVMISVLDHQSDGFSRKYYKLNLERDFLHFLPLSWTIVHPIDESSPFYNKSEEELKKFSFEILIVVKCFDDTFSNVVHRRFSYTSDDDLVIGAKFQRPYQVDENGDIVLDMDCLNTHHKTALNPIPIN